MRLPYLNTCLFVFACALPPFLMEAQEMAIVPVRPSELIKCLPPADPGWRMTVSFAQDIPDAWPRSKATREYHFEGDATGGGASAAGLKVSLTVIDTGGYPDSLQRFAPSGSNDPGAKPDGERITVSDMPAFRRGVPDIKERVDALAFDRFLLIATVEPLSIPKIPPAQKPPKPEVFIEKIDKAVLRQASQKVERLDTSKDHVMVVEKIDQLHPKKSTKSMWSFAVEEQVDE